MAGNVSDQLHAQRGLLQQDGRDRAAELKALAVVSQHAQSAGQIGRDLAGIKEREPDGKYG
jgi:hypothetical protein